MDKIFRVNYLHRGEDRNVFTDSWLAVLLFIEETENENGGYVYMIDVDDKPTYLRFLDHENGTDSWTNIEGEEVNLDQEFRSRV